MIRRPILLCYSMILIGLSSEGASTFSLQYESAGLSKRQIENTHLLLKSLEQLLPASVNVGIGRPVQVKWKDLNPNQSLLLPSCGVPHSTKKQQPFIYAKIPDSPLLPSAQVSPSEYAVELDRRLLQWIELGETHALKYPCQHGHSYRLLQAILLHELFHLYDVHVSSLSSHPLFLNAADWRKAGWLLKTRTTNHNSLPARSPDAYEFKNPQEYLAVNFEFFLLDSTYQCRRPTMAHLFRRFLHHNPFPQTQCQSAVKVRLQMDPINLQVSTLVDLDPLRLYQIDYLLAGKGNAASSRWGHAMFRLVFCRKGRPLGPDCRKDVAHHVVASFAADVDETSVNPVKGLTGGYPSLLFFKRFQQVVDEYSKIELRELRSLPIHLTEKQKHRLLFRFIEIYWSYRGRYRFVTNNCAHEALAAIQVAIASKQLGEKTILTPSDLYDLLVEHRLIDPQLIIPERINSEDLSTSLNTASQNYYVPSYQKNLERSLTHLRGLFVASSLRHHQQIKTLSENAAEEERRQLMIQVLGIVNKHGGHLGAYQKKALVELYRIEDYAFTRSHFKLYQTMGGELKTELQRQGVKGCPVSGSLLESTENSSSLSYGIPLVAEVQFRDVINQCLDSGRTARAFESIVESLKSSHQVELRRLEEMKERKFQILELLSLRE